MRDAECVEFLQWALPRMEMRWRGFRKVRRQVCKRISRRLAELGLGGLEDYRRRLEEDPAEWDFLDACCQITISRFCRDRGVFANLQRRVLPALAGEALRHSAESLRAWSAGCASGEEPYSLKLLWELELAPDFPRLALEIVATDSNAHLLSRAERACYPAGSLGEVPPVWKTRAFQETGSLLCLRPELRAKIEFLHQDIRKELPGGIFDLVLCRNLVFTYYSQNLQEKVLERIASVLRPGGVLVIGGHESLPERPPLFHPIEGAFATYRKV
jgi:chemotaxis protein methyltransferase CheR